MVGLWLLVGFLCIGTIGIFLTWIFCGEGTTTGNILKGCGCVVILAAIISCAFWWLSATESGKRTQKSWESDTKGGIYRQVRVFDVEGDLVEEYTGKFDVEYSNSRILFDDEQGKRHIVYYTTGTIIIDELNEQAAQEGHQKG